MVYVLFDKDLKLVHGNKVAKKTAQDVQEGEENDL